MLAQIRLGERPGDRPGGGGQFTGPPRFLGLLGVVIGAPALLAAVAGAAGAALAPASRCGIPSQSRAQSSAPTKSRLSACWIAASMSPPWRGLVAVPVRAAAPAQVQDERALSGPSAVACRGSWSACRTAARTAPSRDRRGPAGSPADRRHHARRHTRAPAACKFAFVTRRPWPHLLQAIEHNVQQDSPDHCRACCR